MILMRLITSAVIHIIQKMGRCSPNAGIPPLIPKRLDAAMPGCVVGMVVRGKLDISLNPIKECNDCYHEKYISPIQRTLHKGGNQGTANQQRKKMPPDKLKSPDCFPSKNMIHHLSPCYPLILTQLSPGKSIQNSRYLKNGDPVWP
jgi:hypothetical protein